MATDVTIGGDGVLFVGEDKTLRLTVLDPSGVPVDIVGWSMIFDVRDKDNSLDPAILSKTPTVTGTYNISLLTNTQKAIVILTDDDMNLFKGSNLPIGAKTYRHSWKRMTADNETVLCRGDFSPEKATAP